MSLSTRNPTRVLGGAPISGAVDDGFQGWRQGGVRCVTVFSGGLLTGGSGFPNMTAANGHVLITQGAGRLNTVFPHQSISGVAVNFYDSATIARSGVGTIPESGYRLIGSIAPNSFYGPNTLGGPALVLLDMPFTSGLCVSMPSGAPGFTVSYTPAIPTSGTTALT